MHDPFYRKMESRSRPVPGILALDFHDYDQKHDWRTDKLNPFVPTAGSSIWLGNDLRNYTAHTFGAVIRYSFR